MGFLLLAGVVATTAQLTSGCAAGAAPQLSLSRSASGAHNTPTDARSAAPTARLPAASPQQSVVSAGTTGSPQSAVTSGSPGTEMAADDGPEQIVALNDTGLGVYAAATGALQRQLVTGDRIDSLQVTGSDVYYSEANDAADGCRYGVWRVPSRGGAPARVATAPALITGLAVSRDGRWLAYSTATCDKIGTAALTVLDQSTGNRTTMAADGAWVTPLAWSASGVLAVSAEGGSKRLHLLSHPLAAPSQRGDVIVPCPTKAGCTQFAASYDAAGNLYYRAAIDSPGGDCSSTDCSAQTYVNASYDGTRSQVLSTDTGRAGLAAGSISVDSRGSMFLTQMTIPGPVRATSTPPPDGRPETCQRWTGTCTQLRSWNGQSQRLAITR